MLLIDKYRPSHNKTICTVDVTWPFTIVIDTSNAIPSSYFYPAGVTLSYLDIEISHYHYQVMLIAAVITSSNWL